MDRRSDFYAAKAGRCRIRTLPHKAQVPYAARPWARKTAFEFPILGIVRQWAGNTPVQEGRVELEIAPLVESGNAVPITVRLLSPMTVADPVQEIVVCNERNPQREVVRFTFGPAAAKSEASARIRLATSQQLVARARLSDGSQWANYVNVIVTLAACVER